MKLKMVRNPQCFHSTSLIIILNGGTIFKIYERGSHVNGYFLYTYTICCENTDHLEALPFKNKLGNKFNTCNGGRLVFIFRILSIWFSSCMFMGFAHRWSPFALISSAATTSLSLSTWCYWTFIKSLHGELPFFIL